MAKIREVEPKPGYRLLIELDSGRLIFLNLSEKIETVRFHDLKNEVLFNQVETDGYALYWDFGRICMSLSEVFEMTNCRNKEQSEQQASSGGL